MREILAIPNNSNFCCRTCTCEFVLNMCVYVRERERVVVLFVCQCRARPREFNRKILFVLVPVRASPVPSEQCFSVGLSFATCSTTLNSV